MLRIEITDALKAKGAPSSPRPNVDFEDHAKTKRKMRIQTVEELIAGEYKGAKRLRLISCGLSEFPRQILDLADSLETLDLSGNPLSRLPKDFHRLHNLKIAFFSDCKFAEFPPQLAKCGPLEMVAFRGNGMTTIPEVAFPPQLRWLILTNNCIGSLPRSIGQCHRLQKAMLAGNRLESLPDEMADCKKLGLLRISVNNITHLPPWLFSLPELAFLSFAGNPCAPSVEDNPILKDIAWASLSVNETLGEGASGVISKGVWSTDDAHASRAEEEVAIKLFKGSVTSDGSPADEMMACITAGSHPNLIDPIGKIHGHPEGKPGLVLQLIPPHFTNLGLPPSLQSCTRDSFAPGMALSPSQCVGILWSVASAARHLHGRGVAHGDLYAHNVLIDDAGDALLGDFGAASIYRNTPVSGEAMEKLEVLAFGHLIEDLLGFVDHRPVGMEGAFDKLRQLHHTCTKGAVMDRPSFVEVCRCFETLGSRRDIDIELITLE